MCFRNANGGVQSWTRDLEKDGWEDTSVLYPLTPALSLGERETSIRLSEMHAPVPVAYWRARGIRKSRTRVTLREMSTTCNCISLSPATGEG